MNEPQSFTFKLTQEQQEVLKTILSDGNYKPTEVPHTTVSVRTDGCTINLYTSGKCLVQGKKAKEWVEFAMEPFVLQGVGVGYEEVLHPEAFQPHMGVDESGKGDFFGPLVISACYVDPPIIEAFKALRVRDSKTISSDRKAVEMAREIRKIVNGRFSLVVVGPESYNRLYEKMGNVNRLLAWGHARCIENLLERVPDCPRAVADQFGPKSRIERALMQKGRKISLEQRPKAESDPAVAGASILARAGFLEALQAMGKANGITIPKGASDKVREVAVGLVRKHGPGILNRVAKCHFKTSDQVLASAGFSRADLGPAGQQAEADSSVN